MPLPEVKIKAEMSAETTDKVVGFGLRILEPFGLVSDIISDNLTEFRVRNLFAISQRTTELLEINGSKPSQVSQKFLAKFIEEASKEDDSKIQDMWAALLAGESQGAENLIFINILKELTPKGAALLKVIYESALDADYDPNEDFLDSTNQNLDYEYTPASQNARFLISAASATKKGEKSEMAEGNFVLLTHLKHLGLISVKTYKDSQLQGEYSYSTYALITPLGYGFMKACWQFQKEDLPNE